ncbi:MAG: methionine synthase [Anaerolineales bacterium]|nr:methionine synthase [Anaerolineales bacterium]
MDQKVYTNRSYLDALEKRVLVFDGAMGTSLQAKNLAAEDFGGEQYLGCNDVLVLTRPEVVADVHRSFLEAGADVIETNTFRSNPVTLAEYGLDEKVVEINREAAGLARSLAEEYSTIEKPRFVAGSIGPSGKLISANDPDLSNITFEELTEIYRKQAQGLLQGGVDVLLIETSQDLLEVKAAVLGIRQAYDDTGISVPLQAQVTLDTAGRMLLGTGIDAALAALETLGIDVIGLNCSTGPEHMREPIRYLGENSLLPVSCIPNAGLPLNIDGEPVYPLEPRPFAEDLVEFVKKYGISVVGGCCGTTPEHIRLLADSIGGFPHPARPQETAPRLSSAMHAADMQQEPAPFLIGERINTQGSRMAKRLVMEKNFDALIGLGRTQMDNGAHGLDVCVALTERDDERETMHEVVHRLALEVDAPLVIDTTDIDVMEEALQTAPGRCLVNSTHLESGPDRLKKVLSLVHEYGAAVILLTIDEEGMAKTVNRKLEIARRIYQIAVGEIGLQPSGLVFDMLTFTLATGDPEYLNSAKETMDGIRQVKEALPGVLTSLGVSNVSFGLKPAARFVINSVMLYHCVKAGLDMAIVNPATIRPYSEITEEERELAEDLIFNRRPDALIRVIEHFEEVDFSEDSAAEDPTANKNPQERLHWRILTRHREGVVEDIEEIIQARPAAKRSDAALEILNEVLLPAMKEVGDKFGAGELILPFVLQSAEVMKLAVSQVELYLEKSAGSTKGTIVLATVFGDVHDIGKNLVKTILSNNGYRVVDLGKQVPANVIIDKAIEEEADVIGLSALLVSTSKQMQLIVNELQRRELQYPVLIGGAAINRRFGQRILITEDGSPYMPGVFYCRDAFEGLDVMNQLQVPEKREQLVQERLQAAQRSSGSEEAAAAVVSSKRRTAPAPSIPQPPMWGPKLVAEMPLEMVFQHLSKKELFRLSWGARNTRGEAWEELSAEYEKRLVEMQREALQSGWLKPQGVYGYWPVLADGNNLVVYDPEKLGQGKRLELTRFSFPRQDSGEFLCLADYFLETGSEEVDVVALQVVTVGQEATNRFDSLQDADEYSDAYYAHGLAVQTAEAAAEYLHRHIRRELKLEEERGKRYSWGYPAVPELEDHRKVFQLLPAEEKLGMQLTSAYQLVPEQSTAAMVIHHPDAKYFNVGGRS